MALINRTDMTHARIALAEWLTKKIPTASNLAVSELDAPTGSGLSNEIYLFEAIWTDGTQQLTQEMVARVAPTGEGLFPVYDLDAEHRLMSILDDRTGIPVPRVIGVETDEGVLGTSFLVMERVEGAVPSDDPPYTVAGWVTELDSTQRATLLDHALCRLADIHRLDWRALGIDFLDHPEWGRPGLEQQIGYIENLSAYALGGRPNPVIDAARDWVRANRPQEEEPLVLNWGDARPGNMIFGDDLSVAAVLDWEMATIASPELDLGLWLFLQRHHTEGIGAPLPTGFLDHAGTAARYEELTGYRPRNLHYYEVFAGLRAALVMVRFADSMTAAGILPPDTDMHTNNPSAQLLARMLDLPAPTGAATSFIGQRGQ